MKFLLSTGGQQTRETLITVDYFKLESGPQENFDHHVTGEDSGGACVLPG